MQLRKLKELNQRASRAAENEAAQEINETQERIEELLHTGSFDPVIPKKYL